MINLAKIELKVAVKAYISMFYDDCNDNRFYKFKDREIGLNSMKRSEADGNSGKGK